MSNTPETDAAHKASIDDTGCVTRMEPIWGTMERLERERDEARRELAELKNIREEDRVSFNDLRERSHEAHEARDKWKEVAEGLAKALEEAIAWDSQDECGEDAVWLKMAQEALRMFEEAGK